MNLATQNYLVIGVVVAAFAVILPMFLRPYFSGPSNTPTPTQSRPRSPRGGERGHPSMDFGGMPGGHGRPPHMGMGAPHPGMMADMAQDKQGGGGGGGRGGIMSIALPIYSVGIVLYVLYVFYKFYTKGFSNNVESNRSGVGTVKSGRGAKQTPSVEQINNYKQFLLAKEECARRIEEERNGTTGGNGGGGKLSGEQLQQLELRLKEAEEAMERAMEKMGLDIKQLKRDTGYEDPLKDSLNQLRNTMASFSAASTATANTTPAASQPQTKKADSSGMQSAANNGEVETHKSEPVIRFPEGLNKDDKDHDDMNEEEGEVLRRTRGSHLGSEDQHHHHQNRRVSFAEGVDVIKQQIEDQANAKSTLVTVPSQEAFQTLSDSSQEASLDSPTTPMLDLEVETTKVIEEVNRIHPAAEPEGLYLGKPVETEDDSVDSSTSSKTSTQTEESIPAGEVREETS